MGRVRWDEQETRRRRQRKCLTRTTRRQQDPTPLRRGQVKDAGRAEAAGHAPASKRLRASTRHSYDEADGEVSFHVSRKQLAGVASGTRQTKRASRRDEDDEGAPAGGPAAAGLYEEYRAGFSGDEGDEDAADDTAAMLEEDDDSDDEDGLREEYVISSTDDDAAAASDDDDGQRAAGSGHGRKSARAPRPLLSDEQEPDDAEADDDGSDAARSDGAGDEAEERKSDRRAKAFSDENRKWLKLVGRKGPRKATSGSSARRDPRGSSGRADIESAESADASDLSSDEVVRRRGSESARCASHRAARPLGLTGGMRACSRTMSRRPNRGFRATRMRRWRLSANRAFSTRSDTGNSRKRRPSYRSKWPTRRSSRYRARRSSSGKSSSFRILRCCNSAYTKICRRWAILRSDAILLCRASGTWRSYSAIWPRTTRTRTT